MTSLMLVFEVTRDYAIIVPLMIANLVSYFVSRKIIRPTLYEELSRQDGIHLPSGDIRARHLARRVSSVMQQPAELLDAAMTVSEANEFAACSQLGSWPVVNGRRVVGVVSYGVQKRLHEENKDDEALETFVDAGTFPHVHADQSWDIALERMGAAGLDVLPVVSRLNARELIGVVHLSDILNAFGISQESRLGAAGPLP